MRTNIKALQGPCLLRGGLVSLSLQGPGPRNLLGLLGDAGELLSDLVEGDRCGSARWSTRTAQAATRDLLSWLWRDFAVAGVVLALKSPTASQFTGAEVMRWVTLATAVLLVVSLGMTTVTNASFNKFADGARKEWRRKL